MRLDSMGSISGSTLKKKPAPKETKKSRNGGRGLKAAKINRERRTEKNEKYEFTRSKEC